MHALFLIRVKKSPPKYEFDLIRAVPAEERSVERRRENRLKTNRPVTLTILGAIAQPLMEACVLDMSGSGLCLRLPLPVPCGAAVKVDAHDMLMLGEITRCTPEDGAYTVGIHLSHSLAALPELERLNRTLLREDHWHSPRRAGETAPR
jgi:PilZ domain